VPKLFWRVKVAASFATEEAPDAGIAYLERDGLTGLADLGFVSRTQNG
jgi:hypothetical protein